MKYSLFFCFCLVSVWSFPVYSQSNAAANEEIFNFPLVQALLPQFNEVCGDLAKQPLIKGSFEQTKTISRLNRSLVSRGNFIIAAELGMVWDTKSPFPSVMTVGRDYIIQSIPGSNTRTQLDAKGNETFLHLAGTISAIFTGNSQSLLDNFEVYFTQSAKAWSLGLIPREKSIRSFAAKITMTGDSSIRTIYIYEQNGDSIRYVLSDHIFPEILSPEEKALF
ncbi:hypothetical protein FACS189447_04110 [Spirochaetia bacterium]|nr:hypothetical protein FACS189447_04110 [Spirochaetia bacterium]